MFDVPIKPSRGLLFTLLGVGVLVVGLVTADLVVTHVAQDRLSAQISCKLAGSPKVDVSLGGGLLAAAVVVGHPVDVKIKATGVQAADVSADVNVSLDQVRVKHSGDSTTVSTGSGSVDGGIAFDSLSQVSSGTSGQKVTLQSYGDELVASVDGTSGNATSCGSTQQ
jgi:hypothetical protein